MTKIAVTATGTEIGKTYLSSRLLEYARTQSMECQAIKPVMSGFNEAQLDISDAGRLAKACGLDATTQVIQDICRHRFTPELAPNVAAREAGIRLNYDDIKSFCADRLDRQKDLTVFEGAGGLFSPITDEKLNIDLISDLNLPSLLVTANYLGSVSHTLSALEAAETRNATIAAITITRPNDDYGDTESFARELARWTDIPLIPICNDLKCVESVFKILPNATIT